VQVIGPEAAVQVMPVGLMNSEGVTKRNLVPVEYSTLVVKVKLIVELVPNIAGEKLSVGLRIVFGEKLIEYSLVCIATKPFLS
jgi:hypothetical protein